MRKEEVFEDDRRQGRDKLDSARVQDGKGVPEGGGARDSGGTRESGRAWNGRGMKDGGGAPGQNERALCKVLKVSSDSPLMCTLYHPILINQKRE